MDCLKRPVLLALAGLLFVPAGTSAQASSETYDVLVTGGRVVDGTGNPWFRADIGIREGRIAAMGPLDGATAERTIDATGLYVVPGFVDPHSHAADPGRGLAHPDAAYRSAPGLVAQGVTTLVGNQDGRSLWTIADQLARMEELGVGVNTMLLVGHGTVRYQVMGQDHERPATPEEVAEMRALVRQGMEDGAWGISGGYEYPPMRWATTDEIVEVVSELVPWNGVFVVHERASGRQPMWWWPSMGDTPHQTMLDAVLETIEVAERTGVTSIQTHLKVRGSRYWGSSEGIVHQIERARARGVDIWGDQYPYNTTGSDGAMVLLPPFVREAARESGPPADYSAALRRHLEDPAEAERVRADMSYEMYRRGGPRNILILDHPVEEWVGRTLQETADERGIDPVEMGIALQIEGDAARPGGGQIRGFSLAEIDVENFIDEPWVLTGTDAGIALPGDGFVHPRFHGTYPRKIRRYALDKGLTSLEFAIRSMTSLPARVFGLEDRGMLREGNWADVVIFDADAIQDRATALEPYARPEGIEFVLVNGEFVVDGGETTGALPGKVLKSIRVRR